MKARVLMIVGMAAALLISAPRLRAGPYAPAAGEVGSSAVPADSASIRGWASGVVELTRGLQDISAAPAQQFAASFGVAGDSLGPSDASSSSPGPVVSLGDAGHITLSFSIPITNGPGADFAVFENSFSDSFLELAFVEVSSNGKDFFRFPSHSLTQTVSQIDQSSVDFNAIDPTDLDGLAGKYRAGFGTPFDLAILSGRSPLLDINLITQVRLVDVIGSLNPAFGSRDSDGHLINDPWKTNFASGGFDLDAIGVLNQALPEPGVLPALGALVLLAARRRPRLSHV